MRLHLRHRHRKEFDRDIGVERLEDVFRKKGVVNTCIFVFVQLGQLPLPNVDHRNNKYSKSLEALLMLRQFVKQLFYIEV